MRYVHTRRSAALAVVAGLVMALAACGGEDDSSSGTGTAATADSTTNAASGDPIVIGSVASCSGALASSTGGVCSTLKAWEESVNAKGGINGHPVRLIVEDDGGVPEKSAAAVKKLVEQDEVMAIVGEWSVGDVTWQEYVEQKGVPVVGGGSTNPPFSASPMFFPSGSQVPPFQYAYATLAKDAGHTKIGILYCSEAPTCATNTPLLTKINELYDMGIEIVYSQAISASQPNYTANCLAAKEKGAETIIVLQGADHVKRLVEDCAKQGYEPQVLMGSGLNPVNAAVPALEGAIGVNTNVPIADESLAVSRDFRAAVEKYAPELEFDSPQWNGSAAASYAGGLLFEAAAKAGDIGPESTPDDVKKGLYALEDETLGGFAPPLNFEEGKVAQVKCAFTLGVENGKLSTPNGAEPICIPGTAEQYQQLLDALQG